jgi:hypothetical protein
MNCFKHLDLSCRNRNPKCLIMSSWISYIAHSRKVRRKSFSISASAQCACVTIFAALEFFVAVQVYVDRLRVAIQLHLTCSCVMRARGVNK